MNLIVATRVGDFYVRFDVEGKWAYGDALQLAYLIKAGALRAGLELVLVDLRRVTATPAVEGALLICNRLHRAMAAPARIALVADSELIDGENAPDTLGQGVNIACFTDEGTALQWLHRKNPPDLRAEG